MVGHSFLCHNYFLVVSECVFLFDYRYFLIFPIFRVILDVGKGLNLANHYHFFMLLPKH